MMDSHDQVRPLMRSLVLPAAVVIALLLVLPAAATADEPVYLIDESTPWRVHLAAGPDLLRTDEGQPHFSERGPEEFRRLPRDPRLPPAGWTDADFDDHHWPEYQPDELDDFVGGYGAWPMGGRDIWLTKLSLRTRFGIEDPRQVRDLKVTVTCLGGGVVYVNGVEVGRGYMPDGELHPVTPADDYPTEAYVDEYGEPLPRVGRGEQPEPEWKDRYDKRVRTFTVAVPREVLRSGSNVLAVDLHRSARTGPFSDQWDHVGFRDITLTGRGDGVIAYDEALSETRVWTPAAEQQVCETLPAESLIRRSWFWTMYWARGMPVQGVSLGNPFDPLVPVRMAIPRNGVGSGQAVISDPDGLTGVSAELAGDLTGPGGARLAADSVDIRYAVQRQEPHYADALMPEPPEDARTVPVWLLVDIPENQRPGWYTTELKLQANGHGFSVPVQVLVTGYRMPESRDYEHSTIVLTQSPKSVALHYGVEPWSQEHWRLLEPSLELLGQVGNDVVTVPVILSNFPAAGRPHPPDRSEHESTWRLPLVRWVRTADGLEPDFSILRRFLDLYEKHAGPPEALSLWVWEPASSREVARAYEGTGQETVEHEPKAPVLVEVWDPQTGETEKQEVPAFLDEGAEEFWKPFFDGVREVVTERGWDERTIVLGLGSDVRPGSKTADRIRDWAPYARWDLLSHFSADPGSHFYKGDEEAGDALEAGKLIAVGGLEIGIKRWPQTGPVLDAEGLEQRLQRPLEYLQVPTGRWHHQPWSPPLLFRTLPQLSGKLGHVGLDFWMPKHHGPSNRTFFSHVNELTAPGPDGAVPTVRFRMLREGVQDFELRMVIVRGYMDLDEEQRKPYRDLLDELPRRVNWSRRYLSQHELSYDFPAYIARLQQAAAELAGVESDATWDNPPE
ncbi:MAG: glycoside hydrolase domain-containing protein [Phycisphaerae bacterium]